MWDAQVVPTVHAVRAGLVVGACEVPFEAPRAMKEREPKWLQQEVAANETFEVPVSVDEAAIVSFTFVVDEGNARVQVYSVADGAFVRTIFLPEGKPDDTNKWYPKGVALHAEKKDGTPDLFVLEVAISGIEFSSRVQVLNISSGRPNRSFDVPKDVFNPGPSSLGLSGYAHGLAVAGRPLNAVIVGDMIGSSIGVVPHNKGPSLVGGITNPFGFAIYVDRKNADNMKVYVSSLEGGTVHILSPAGEGALKADEKFKIDGASGLTGLRLSADGTKLYACDQGAGCVWILSTVEEAAAA